MSASAAHCSLPSLSAANNRSVSGRESGSRLMVVLLPMRMIGATEAWSIQNTQIFSHSLHMANHEDEGLMGQFLVVE